jgi:hypothetical protein
MSNADEESKKDSPVVDTSQTSKHPYPQHPDATVTNYVPESRKPKLREDPKSKTVPELRNWAQKAPKYVQHVQLTMRSH